ncbi:MAG: Fic family protein [Chloroflexota bacterium]
MQRPEFSVEQQHHLLGLPTGVWAYVPPPLPPSIDPRGELFVLNGQAERALGLLGGIGMRLPNPYVLIGPFVRREAVLSSRIEGTEASLSDLVAFEAAARPPAGPSDVLEVSNYVRALNWGLSPEQTLPLSLRLMRELHRILMTGVRGHERTPGEFRTYQNHIGRPGSKIEDAIFVPPPPVQMRRAMEDFETYLHADTKLPDLVRLAIIHYQFEAIHPFGDGNGRVGRLLISLLLVKQRILPQPLLYLSAFFDRNRADYYSLLLSVSQTGSWEPWVEFFLTGVADQAEDAVKRGARLLELRDQYSAKLMTARGSAMPIKLLDELFSAVAITIPRAAEVLGVTRPAATKTIAKLEAAGIVREITGRQRYRLYVAEEIVRVVDTDFHPEDGEDGTEQLALEMAPPRRVEDLEGTVSPS